MIAEWLENQSIEQRKNPFTVNREIGLNISASH